MKTAILLLNFGEPENPTAEEVIPFLERIFRLNAPLLGPATPDQVRERSRRLAEERAPGLIAEYELIGGSPLRRQAEDQARLLEEEMVARGHDAMALVGMQFTDPSIGEAVTAARRAGASRIVGLPVYPIPGPTTTFAALSNLRDEVRRQGWAAPVHEITGWYRHPAYIELRARVIQALAAAAGISLADPATRLVFSAHGTPTRYLDEGSRYDLYVQDFCASVAAYLGVPEYVIGYQNHSNRPGVAWTEPEIADVIDSIQAERVLVDPVSFMHEQSETLAELDHELKERAVGRGLTYHRVPIPYAAPAFISLLADLAEEVLGNSSQGTGGLEPCLCSPLSSAVCLNAALRRGGGR